MFEKLIKQIVGAAADAKQLLAEHDFDLDELIKAENFKKIALLKDGAEAMSSDPETKKSFDTYANEISRLVKYLDRNDITQDVRDQTDAICAIFREMQKKRKHIDTTDLMVEINHIINENVEIEHQEGKVRDLFDSMMCGYPIGYLMLWECPTLEKKKSIGVDAHSYDSPKEVIIDGQQRLTSLYAVIKGKKVINSKFDEKAIIISYCPLENKFEVGTNATKRDPEWIYNISELFMTSNAFKYTGDFIQALKNYRESKEGTLTDDEQAVIADHINGVFNLKSYTLPIFSIKSNAEEENVSEIFVRVNSGGVPLKQNDFILTLLSLYWDEGRREIEAFSKESTVPVKGNAYVASLNIMNAKILFSKSSLLVSKLFELGTDGNRKSLEKHHLFPKAYLRSQGYKDSMINQMANYAFIDWKDNMDILDDAPSVYYPIVCDGRSEEEILQMEQENALPHGWENMVYEDFLVERRKLMAARIKEAFEQLRKNAE